MLAKSPRRSSAPSTKFTPEQLELYSRHLKTGHLPLERFTMSDDVVTGLRAVLHKSGRIAFHASYYVGEKRPFMLIGTFNKGDPDYITIEEARNLTRTIKALGDKGIDPQSGLQRRLIRELKRDGTNWRVSK